MSTAFSASIVICTLNRASDLRSTLRSLRQLDYDKFEVIVVNGPSTDDTDAVLEEFAPDIKVIRDNERNLSTSRNLGIAAASGDITAFLDDDAIPHPTWLKAIAPRFHDDRIAGMGGYTVDYTGVRYQFRKIICDRFGNAYKIPDWFDERALCFPGTPYYPSLLGTNAVFRTSVLRKVGGWDDAYVRYLDETDVCLRIVDQGLQIGFEPSALVYHQYTASDFRDERRIDRTLYPQGVSKAYFIMRHGTALGLARAGNEIKVYEDHVAESQRWLADHNDISQEHRYSLEQDLSWGLAHGVDTARERAGKPPESRPIIKDQTPFTDFGRREEKLKVCLVSQGFPPQLDAGIARWTAQLAAGLASRGHRVHVITRSSTQDESVKFENGIWVHTCRPSGEAIESYSERYQLPPAMAEWCARVYREVQFVKTFGLDIVSFPIWDLEGIACLDDPEIATCMSLHTTYATGAKFRPDWQARPLFKAFHVDKMIAGERDCLTRSPLLLGNSKQTVQDIESTFGIDIKERSVIVHHSTEDLLGGAPLPKRAGSDLKVLFVGRFESRKGIDIAFAAADRALATDAPIQFWFAGGEVDPTAIMMMPELKNVKISSDRRVTLIGPVERSRLEDLYRSCDIVLMPSRYESFGLVAIEAMSAGKPVIALDVGGPREIIVNGTNGIMIAADETAAEKIAEILVKLSRDPDAVKSLAKGARQTFLDHFTIEREMIEIEGAFRREIKRKRGGDERI